MPLPLHHLHLLVEPNAIATSLPKATTSRPGYYHMGSLFVVAFHMCCSEVFHSISTAFMLGYYMVSAVRAWLLAKVTNTLVPDDYSAPCYLPPSRHYP